MRMGKRQFFLWCLLVAFMSAANYSLLENHSNMVTVAPTLQATVERLFPTLVEKTSTPTVTVEPTKTATISPSSTPNWGLVSDMYFATLPYGIMRYPSEWRVSEDGVRFVASFEGFFGRKYNDGNNFATEPGLFYSTNGSGTGNCTIGYGHLLHLGPCNGSEGWDSGISQGDALILLRQELDNCGGYVDDMVSVKITQNQFNVMASLICGVGKDRAKGYKFTAMLNEGKYVEAAEQLKQTGVYGIGIGLCPGLVRRRAEEAYFFARLVPMWPVPAEAILGGQDAVNAIR